MLEVGNPGLSINEARAHFTMWCMLAAPLITGNDLQNMSAEIKAILINKDLIAIDQDPLGQQGFKIHDEGNFEIWQKTLSNDEIAICLLNLETRKKEYTVNWEKLKIKDFHGTYSVRELWSDMTVMDTSIPASVIVNARDVVVFKLAKK
jgi:alpha-galactosidase